MKRSPIAPAALQGLLSGMTQDALHRLERGFQQQEGILLGGGKSGSNVGGCHGDQRQYGAATGPSPAEARHQEDLRLERSEPANRDEWLLRLASVPFSDQESFYLLLFIRCKKKICFYSIRLYSRCCASIFRDIFHEQR